VKRIALGLAGACLLAGWLRGQALENASLQVAIATESGALAVTDKRFGYTWRQEAPAEPVFAPDAKWVLPAVPATPVIDGDLADWPAAQVVTLDHTMTADARDVRDDADCSATIRLCRAGEKAVYLAATVRDDALVFRSDRPEEWHGDSVEFWLGPRNFGFYLLEGQCRAICWAQRELAADCAGVIKPVPGGWQLEARIGLDHMPDVAGAFRQGQAVPMAIGINDADDKAGRQGQIYAPRGYVHRRIDTYAAGLSGVEPAAGRALRLASGFHGETWQVTGKLTGVLTGTWVSETLAETPMTVRFALAEAAPDLSVTLEMPADSTCGRISYPLPMSGDTADGVALIPRDEGFMVRADDTRRQWSVGTPSMPWIGFTHLRQGHGFIMINETPDDVTLMTGRSYGKVGVYDRWEPSMGTFGYPRRVLYSFLAQGRHVAVAKRYRQYALEHGILKTLREKEAANPNFGLLRGAVDIYGGYGEGFLTVLKDAGIDRAIIHGENALAKAHEMGYVTSLYDIYTDLHPPESPRSKWERNRYYRHPEDTIKTPDGKPRWGWDHEFAPDRKTVLFPSHIACSSRQLWNMKQKIPAAIAGRPFRARFLDCTTAAGLFECYDPAHRMTQTQDRELRGEMFAYLWELSLIPGSERGRWWAMPWIGYMEGIQSTGDFRDTDISGWPIDRPARATEAYLTTELGPAYRLPLFSLVFHECALTTWWWGDQNHRIPEVWARKDLIQVLYGSTPLWFLSKPNEAFFYSNFDRFARCYEHVCRWQRTVADAELLDHEILSDDMALQRTAFAGGWSVTANLGADPKTMADGRSLPGYHYVLSGPLGVDTPLPLGRIVDPGVHWQPAPAQELPLNGDFERFGTMGWDGTAGIQVSLSTDGGHSGRGALRLSGRNDDSFGLASGRTKAMAAGERWRLTAWMRIDRISRLDTKPCLKVQLDSQGRYVTNVFTTSYDTGRLGTWQSLELTFVVPPDKGIDEGRICIEKRLRVPLEVDLRVDDISLTKAE